MFLIATAIVSLMVGVYTFLQQRKMMKKNKPKAESMDSPIASEGVRISRIGGSPHVYGNDVDAFGESSRAIKSKGKKK